MQKYWTNILRVVIAVTALSLAACDVMQNNIDENTLACGAMDGEQNFTWLQIQDENAQTLDLNQSKFSLVDGDLKPLQNLSYRISSKGCLGVPRQQDLIIRIPGKQILFTKVEPSSTPLQLLSAKALETPLKVSLEPSKPVYQGKASVRVKSSEKSLTRYCLENLMQPRCIPSSDLNVLISSQEFLLLQDAVELPFTDGRYRLHILSEARDGSLSLNPFDFSIDNISPQVIPDFTERFSMIRYFGAPTYFVETGYPIKFLSLNDSLAGTHIEYCLVPQDSPSKACSNPLTYGVENPLVVSKGAARLMYRAYDEAGNGASENWQSVSIMSRSACKVSDFLKSVNTGTQTSCQVLVGDLDLNMIDPKAFSLLDQIIEVSGRILYASETATSVPMFRNLYAAESVEFNLGAELKTDFLAFPELHRLKELNLRLAMGGKSIDTFNEITQLLRVRLMNLENVKDMRIFRKLQAVDDTMWLAGLGTATNLDFLSALTRAGNLRVTNNGELRDVSGLRNLTSVANLEIAYNPKLASLKGFEGVTWLEKLTLSGLDIVDFSGFSNLKEITVSLLVQMNPKLASVNGFDSLQKVSYFLFRDNDVLPAGTQLLGKTIEQ